MKYKERNILDALKLNGKIIYEDDLSDTDKKTMLSLVHQGSVQRKTGSWSGLPYYELASKFCNKCKQTLLHK